MWNDDEFKLTLKFDLIKNRCIIIYKSMLCFNFGKQKKTRDSLLVGASYQIFYIPIFLIPTMPTNNS